jgi:signal transduction histidine kinase
MTTEITLRGNVPTGTATGTALTALIAMAVASPACLLAVYLAPLSLRAEIAWTTACCAVLLCAAVATAAHQRLTVRRLRRLVAEKDAAADAARAAAERFAEVTVPHVVLRLRSGAAADTALAAVPRVEDETQRRVLHTLATEVHRGESRRSAAVTACANAAGRVQALTTSMAADLRDMEHRHGDPDVLTDLLHLDHRTAQAGRLADSIAVLTGARSGRRWAKPIRMESILRGAMGRIQGYQRVRLHSTSTVAVAGHAAEGVMHALAEIMDNAANFSPPTAEVHVYVEEVSAGVVVTVEDGGLVMGEDALSRAQDAVEPRSPRDLSALPGTRLGLSVVGRLAHKHGLTVSFRPSAHGGTGVLLRIPQQLVAAPAPPRGAAPRGAAAGHALAGGPDDDAHPRGAAAEPAASTRTASPAAGDRSPAGPQPSAGLGAAAAGSAAPQGSPGDADALGHAHDGDRTAGSGRPEHGRDPHAGADDAGADTAREHRRRGVDASDGAFVEYGESGLPRRRRGRTLAAAQTAVEAAAERPRQTRSAAESASRLGAFRNAVRRAEAPGTAPGGPDTDTASPASPDPASSRPEDHPA